jgi:hypothetical protein
MESGSLLWIHGKRKYSIAVVLIVTNDSRIDSWLWEDYSQVFPLPVELPHRTEIRPAP